MLLVMGLGVAACSGETEPEPPDGTVDTDTAKDYFEDYDETSDRDGAVGAQAPSLVAADASEPGVGP